MSELLSVRQAAAILGVHENTVRHWADKGILQPAARIGTRAYRRFRPTEVERVRLLSMDDGGRLKVRRTTPIKGMHWYAAEGH